MALLKGRGRPAKKPVNARPGRKKGGGWGRIAFAVLVMLAVLALAFFLVVRDAKRVSVAENVVGSVFSPVQNAVSSATSYVRDVVNGVKDYFKMGQDLALANQELAQLRQRLLAMEQESLENQRLKTALSVKEANEDSDPLFARVIARGPGVWMDVFTINRGTNDGIAVDMPVIDHNGALVGRVFEVWEYGSKVLSLIDPRSRSGCMIERTRDVGSLWGKVESDSITAECNMYYLPAVNDIVPGDVVLTSGMDGILPKGLLVGTVASISRQSDLSDRYIVVLPSADFLHIEEVLVLRVAVDDKESLVAVPTPTPRPTPEPTPTPRPVEGEPEEPIDESPYWNLPTPLPDSVLLGEEPAATPELTPTPTPSVTYDPESMAPEDKWAQ